jgi:hypothetical protein
MVAISGDGTVLSKQKIGDVASSSGGSSSGTDAQATYLKYKTDVQKILKEVDSMNAGGNDQQLSDWEQETAVQRVMVLLGISREAAYDVVNIGFGAGGYSAWKG